MDEEEEIRWVLMKTFSTEEEAIAMQMKLEEAGIPARCINRIDSVYPMMGNVELFVPENDSVLAKFVLEQNLP